MDPATFRWWLALFFQTKLRCFFWRLERKPSKTLGCRKWCDASSTRQFLNTNTINIFLFILIESIHLQNRHETCFHLPSCLSPLVATSRSKRIMEPWPIEQGLSNRAIFGCLFRRSCQNSFGIKFTSSSLTSKINASSFPSVYCVPLLWC